MKKVKNNFLENLLKNNHISQQEFDFLFEPKEMWGEEEEDHSNIDKFEKLINRIIKYSENESKNKAIDFSYVVFPEINFSNITSISSKKINFFKSLFQGEADFSNIQFNCELNFSSAAFNSSVNFRNVTFNKIVKFYKTTFKDEVLFENANFNLQKTSISVNKKVDFRYTTFEHKIDFQGAVFHCEVTFQFAKFNSEETFFESSVFKEESTFYRSVFKEEIDFTNAMFEKKVIFSEIIGRKVIFDEAFLYEADFSFANIKNLSLKKSKIKSITLDNLDCEKINVLFLESIDDVETKKSKLIDSDAFSTREDARIIKDIFENQNNIIESNKYYRIEMDKWRDEIIINQSTFIEKIKTFFSNRDFFNLTIYKNVSDYATNWIKVLYLILIIGFSVLLISFTHDFPHIDSIWGIIFSLLLLIILITMHVLNKSVWTWIGFLLLIVILFYSNLPLLDKMTHYIYLFNKPDTFIEIIVKLVFAYLAYQFTISLRQNTRRK